MTLLDRFRTTSSLHKHPDAAVRLAFVEEVPIEDRALIAEMARDDGDARVRKAAVAKLLDPAVLASVVSAEPDEAVRAQALAMLRDIALDAFEGVTEGESLVAVEVLHDARMLTHVAKGALRENVALAALARLDDPRARGSVARHAACESVRRAALDVLQDHAEIVAVAMNSEFRDTALAALDRLGDRQDLDHIAAHATNKHAAKRARGLQRELDERANAEARARDAAAAEARQIEAAERARQAAELAEAEKPSHEAPTTEIAIEPMADTPAVIEPAAGSTTESAAEAAPPVAGPDAEAARLADAEARAAQADARARRDALGRLRNLVSRVDGLVAKPDLTLKAAERARREVRAALADMPPLLGKDDRAEVGQRLEAALAALSPRALELREAADWRQFMNAGIQEQLCVRMEALDSASDPEALLTSVRELQQQWRTAADVPRAQADALWKRFKAAHDRVWPRCEEWLAGQAARRAGHFAQKVALCERVEALADSTRWLQTAEEIKKLQAEWKTIGLASRGQEKALWDRFRTACDRFFTRRNEDLKQRKGVWAENLAKKDVLCAKAEALAESTDWDAAAAAVKALQAEWKTIGPVKKSRSEPIWLRFRAACDAFFARYGARHDAGLAERIAARDTICDELERLGAPTAEPPADLPALLRGIEGRWRAIGAGRDRTSAADARHDAAWTAALARWPEAIAGTDLDPDIKRRRLEALSLRVERLAAEAGGTGDGAADAALSPTERLARQLKERLASNTIGGKTDEGARWRAAAEEVRQAQAQWACVGPVPEDVRRPLAERFDRACRLILGKAGAPSGSPVVGRSPGGRRPR